jgi:hypothetical protein
MRRLIVVASALVFAGAAAAQDPNNAQPGNQTVTVTCAVGNVAVFGDRVHVRCSAIQQVLTGVMGQGAAPAQKTPAYYAVGLQAEPALANLTLTLATQAAAQHKQVQIFYINSPNQNPPGCQPYDCRRLTGIVMLVQN